MFGICCITLTWAPEPGGTAIHSDHKTGLASGRVAASSGSIVFGKALESSTERSVVN